MSTVKFNESLCKGCGLCVSVCPKEILYLSDNVNVNGYNTAAVNDMKACIGCGNCARICPDYVITVERG